MNTPTTTKGFNPRLLSSVSQIPFGPKLTSLVTGRDHEILDQVYGPKRGTSGVRYAAVVSEHTLNDRVQTEAGGDKQDSANYLRVVPARVKCPSPKMIANTVTNTNLSHRSILEKDKLTESNFSRLEAQSDDCTQAREKVEKAPPAKATVTVRNAYRKHSDYLLDVGYLMLATMSLDFRTRLININAHNMIH
ncbi:hypothetical protein OSB04_030520 [Centaurea solstitialis]|uniref:Uncharacterized protein n=1 Tax=Centaurea solstitialis TaxID=347529 RepID=A0AA38VTC8_9ASTR|nr:hypothetical protein OSB04_030520 [Centaurea solstitialis]